MSKILKVKKVIKVPYLNKESRQCFAYFEIPMHVNVLRISIFYISIYFTYLYHGYATTPHGDGHKMACLLCWLFSDFGVKKFCYIFSKSTHFCPHNLHSISTVPCLPWDSCTSWFWNPHDLDCQRLICNNNTRYDICLETSDWGIKYDWKLSYIFWPSND